MCTRHLMWLHVSLLLFFFQPGRIDAEEQYCYVANETENQFGATGSFTDVPPEHWAYRYIELLHSLGFVSGCEEDPPRYCPEKGLTRAEMAVFIVRGVHGSSFMPPNPTAQIFQDVPVGEWYAKWVHQLWNDGFTAGCSTDPLMFCPNRVHTRAEATVFFLRMLKGVDYIPPVPRGIFSDVVTDQWYAKWVEEAYREGLIPPCQISDMLFCPEGELTRAMAAYMMVQAKDLMNPDTDLLAEYLEVTQAVQDLKNSVRLVAGKRTYVRFHVRASGKEYATMARLRLQKPGELKWISPIPSRLEIKVLPFRSRIDHSFLFEIPTGYNEGRVTLTAELNPPCSTRAYSPLEKNYSNNTISAAILFEQVPTVNFVIYRVGYKKSGIVYYPPLSDAIELTHYLRCVYPMSSTNFWLRDYFYDDNGDRLPNCVELNAVLSSIRIKDRANNTVPPNTRYYGMVDRTGFWMRGCAEPSLFTSCGVNENETGAHELAHNFGRNHPCCPCGEDIPWDLLYPYDEARISQEQTGEEALYGFHINTNEIFQPHTRDFMSYCPAPLWISDHTYEGLLNHFQAHLGPPATDPGSQNRMDRLLVIGTFDSLLSEVDLQPIFVLPNVGELQDRMAGDFAIVLRDLNGGELARYPFSVSRIVDSELFEISELVPYVEGTTRLDIELKQTILKTIEAGPNPPQVNITSPVSEDDIKGDSVQVSWDASDVDGDPLVFDVEYSDDYGQNWNALSIHTTRNSLIFDMMPIENIGALRFKVWATDGIHTSADVAELTLTSIAGRENSSPRSAVMKTYPNPFNASTTIIVTLLKAGDVTLRVYNAMGEEVAVLMDQKLPPGLYRVNWNALDMASGVYLCVLKTSDITETAKMILIR